MWEIGHIWVDCLGAWVGERAGGIGLQEGECIESKLVGAATCIGESNTKSETQKPT